MARYEILFRKSAANDLRDLPREDVSRILECFEALADNPRAPGCEKLSGQEKYRIRRGAYRIIYEIKDEALLIMVVKVGHRRDIYRN